MRSEPACDTTNRFELNDLTNTDVKPTWTNYTGGDSITQVATSDHAIYIGGHFRFLNNNLGSDGVGGPGSQDRRGLAILDPLNGLVIQGWRSDRSPRGVGTFALAIEPEGLYIGDDTDFLNGSEHKKLKFLSITDNVIDRPEIPTLPATLIANDTIAGIFNSSVFNGDTISEAIPLSEAELASEPDELGDVNNLETNDTTESMAENLPILANEATAALSVGSRLIYATTSGDMRINEISNSSIGGTSVVNLLGLGEEQWPISQLGGMFFDAEFSRVYYTLQNNPTLFYRAFAPDGTFFGENAFEASEQADILWADVTSMDVIDNQLYFTLGDNNNLYRAQINGADVVSGTTMPISGPSIDGRSWGNTMLAFAQ